MSRAAARRTWEAARDRGVKPLSWRMYDTLLDAANMHGTHEANNGAAAYALERKGLVTFDYPRVHATAKGREVLAAIARGSKPCCEVCAAPGPKLCGRCSADASSATEYVQD